MGDRLTVNVFMQNDFQEQITDVKQEMPVFQRSEHVH
jgi:hypothetical protein